MTNNKLPFKFISLVGSQFFSKVGDFAHDIVFVLLSIELSHGNYFIVGITYFVKFIPYLFLGPLGGAVSDLYNRKKIMLVSDVFRCGLTIILAV